MRVMLTCYIYVHYGPTANPDHSVLALNYIHISLILYGAFTETVLL